MYSIVQISKSIDNMSGSGSRKKNYAALASTPQHCFEINSYLLYCRYTFFEVFSLLGPQSEILNLFRNHVAGFKLD
jgi:hypothetical protein